MGDELYGYLSAVGAVVFFGSIGLMIKSRNVTEAKVDPMIFQLYYSLAIFISSWFVLSYEPFVFTYWGIVGAALWVPASILSIFAIKYIGLSIAQGVWSGSSILVSFLWGSIFYHMIDDSPKYEHTVKSIPLAVVALATLCIGILGLAVSGTKTVADCRYYFPLVDSFFARFEKPKSERRIDINSNEKSYKIIESDTDESNRHNEEECMLPEAKVEEEKEEPISILGKLFGLLCAIALGIPNGSMLVPLRLAPEDAQGINYMISFGIGVLGVTPILTTIYFILKREVPVFHIRVALVPGICAGFIWNLGNYCSIYATIYLGLTIGFPLTQLALLVGGLYGIFVFREITSWFAIIFFFISAGILLGGAALLSVFG